LLVMHRTAWGHHSHIALFGRASSVIYQSVHDLTPLHMHRVLTTTIGVPAF